MLRSMIRVALAIVSCSVCLPALAGSSQWSPIEAKQWSQKQGWIVGANYINASSVNALEMWQKDTFNLAQIDAELALAEDAGFTSMRVFLHDLVWRDDQDGFTKRIDQFLTVASKHGIRPIFVLFDSCWNPNPQAGLQPAPVNGVHNSGWVQSPGIAALSDVKQYSRLRRYVSGVIRKFAQDKRVLAWDVWNEPDNLNGSSYNDSQTKLMFVEKMVPEVFRWARSARPTQPLTSAVWAGEWSPRTALNAIQKAQLDLSDIVSFHSYDAPDRFRERLAQLASFNRPLICTEYMARPLGSTVSAILPIAKANNVGTFNWGFVAGKTQTYFPWDSWKKAYPAPPAVWFHDLFRTDHSPYDVNEIAFIKSVTKRQ